MRSFFFTVGDERHLPFGRAEVDLLGYDYTALGHIHKPDLEMKGKCRYSGSLEPTDPNDIGKTWLCHRYDRTWCGGDRVCSGGKERISELGHPGGSGDDRAPPSGEVKSGGAGTR